MRQKENVNTLWETLQYRHADLPAAMDSIPSLADCQVYDLSDGKALYLLLDHAHWQCNDHPYLLCKCNRGDDNCQGIVADEEYMRLFKESEKQWSKREVLTQDRVEFGDGTPYSLKVHRKWCQQENFGVRHMGAMPCNYKISQIRFDVFHGRGGIIKVIVKYIRKQFEGIPRNVTLFAAFLRKLPSWDSYVIDPWVSNATNSRLKGRHTAAFCDNIHECIAVLKKLSPGGLMNDLCESLAAFHTMSKILGFVIVDQFNMAKHVLGTSSNINDQTSPQDIANAVMSKYDELVVKFRKYGLRSFMTNRRSGDKETFYVHVLTRYMPKIMRETYQRHSLGVGIFSMEGFEYKNYTSKQVLNNRTNGKVSTNIVLQSMRVLQLLFGCAYVDPDAEIKRRNILNKK